MYGNMRTCDCLTVEIKMSQHVTFQGRHDCRLTTTCTDKTHINTNTRTESSGCYLYSVISVNGTDTTMSQSMATDRKIKLNIIRN